MVEVACSCHPASDNLVNSESLSAFDGRAARKLSRRERFSAVYELIINELVPKDKLSREVLFNFMTNHEENMLTSETIIANS